MRLNRDEADARDEMIAAENYGVNPVLTALRREKLVWATMRAARFAADPIGASTPGSANYVNMLENFYETITPARAPAPAPALAPAPAPAPAPIQPQVVDLTLDSDDE